MSLTKTYDLDFPNLELSIQPPGNPSTAEVLAGLRAAAEMLASLRAAAEVRIALRAAASTETTETSPEDRSPPSPHSEHLSTTDSSSAEMRPAEEEAGSVGAERQIVLILPTPTEQDSDDPCEEVHLGMRERIRKQLGKNLPI